MILLKRVYSGVLINSFLLLKVFSERLLTLSLYHFCSFVVRNHDKKCDLVTFLIAVFKLVADFFIFFMACFAPLIK